MGEGRNRLRTADGFQVSISALTLGTLYEAVLAFSSQRSLDRFWPSVCLNGRWLIPSRRMGVVLCKAGTIEVAGMFEHGRFQAATDPEFERGEGLRAALSRPTAHWIDEPWKIIDATDYFSRWLLQGKPDALFVVPLRVEGKNMGGMLFAVAEVGEADRAMLNTLGTIYALHVGMAYRLLRISEESRQIQEQLITQEKMASLGSLVAGILHEINTPLGAIGCANDVSVRCVSKMADVLEVGEHFPQIDVLQGAFDVLRENSAVAAQGAARIKAIVQSLKNFARLDEAEYQLADLQEGIESVLTLMGAELKGRVALVKEFGNVPRTQCCPGPLNQVFMSLLKNAAEAIEGQGTIRVRTFVAEERIHIEISDDGRGIPPEKLRRLFEVDFSARGSRVKMGAGLATANTIVQRHGGRIDVESEVGKGSRFTVILPRDSGNAASQGDSSPNAKTTAETRRRS